MVSISLNNLVKSWLVLLVILPGLVLGLAGCTARPIPQTRIQVTMQDNRYLPGAWRVPAGQVITVAFNNKDPIAHDWTILVGDNALNPDAFEKPYLFWSHAVPGGTEETITFQAPAAAAVYRVVCSLPGHAADAMQGRLTVVQP